MPDTVHTTRARVRRGAIALCALAAMSPSALAATMPRITVRGDRLYAGTQPWRAWGMNWGVGNHEPVISYFDDPSRQHLRALGDELRRARAIGANSMRVYLQLGQVMASATTARERTLIALQRLLALAQRDGIYLDITGDLTWLPARVPAWYTRLARSARWAVEARFWTAVAHAAAPSPAVLCYELTSEPMVSSTRGIAYGPVGRWWFVRGIAQGTGARADTLARSWTRLLAGAVRAEDNRPVTIGLLPLTAGPFSPGNVGALLDMLVVHDYPTTGQAAAGVSLIRSYASYGKPVLLGETFALQDDLATQDAFLTGAAPELSGAFEFFDGRDPRQVTGGTIGDAMYRLGLLQFMQLRPLFDDPAAQATSSASTGRSSSA